MTPSTMLGWLVAISEAFSDRGSCGIGKAESAALSRRLFSRESMARNKREDMIVKTMTMIVAIHVVRYFTPACFTFTYNNGLLAV